MALYVHLYLAQRAIDDCDGGIHGDLFRGSFALCGVAPLVTRVVEEGAEESVNSGRQ